MNRLLITVCAALFATFASADANVNLTYAVRQANSAGLCGAPSITGAGHAS